MIRAQDEWKAGDICRIVRADQNDRSMHGLDSDHLPGGKLHGRWALHSPAEVNGLWYLTPLEEQGNPPWDYYVTRMRLINAGDPFIYVHLSMLDWDPNDGFQFRIVTTDGARTVCVPRDDYPNMSLDWFAAKFGLVGRPTGDRAMFKVGYATVLEIGEIPRA